MSKAARHQRLLEYVTTHGEAAVERLAAHLGVSAMTVRRDLDELARAGRLQRVHGGALPPVAGSISFHFQRAPVAALPAKRALARHLAARLRPGMSIALDTGTTTLEIGRACADCSGLTVLTTSLAVAALLQPAQGIDLILVGGTVRKRYPDLVGPLTEANLRQFRVDLAMVGADAIAPNGTYAHDPAVARLTATMAEHAARVIVVADSTKFAARAVNLCLLRERIDELVTDDGCPADVRARYRGGRPTLTLVPLPG
jgi:DeoR family glycerol-3-phosphate regulon repressor